MRIPKRLVRSQIMRAERDIWGRSEIGPEELDRRDNAIHILVGEIEHATAAGDQFRVLQLAARWCMEYPTKPGFDVGHAARAFGLDEGDLEELVWVLIRERFRELQQQTQREGV